LGVAFFEGDLDAVDELCEQVIVEGAAHWKLRTTFDDLVAITGQTRDAPTREGLERALDRLRALLPTG
jgi:hypothetical protein